MSRTTAGPIIQAAGYPAAALALAAARPPRPAGAQVAPEQPPQPKTLNLLGTVLGPDGQPVPGAEVGVVDPTRGERKLDGLFTTKCGGAGEFELATTDLSEWYGPWATYCVLARSGDGVLMGAAVVAAADVAQPLEVVLQPAGYIHSSVLNPTGVPLAGIGTRVRAPGLPAMVRGPRTNDVGELRAGPLPAGVPLGVSVAPELRHLVPHNTWDGKEITLQPGETYCGGQGPMRPA